MRKIEQESSINLRIRELINVVFSGNNSKFARFVGVNESNVRNYIENTEPKYTFLRLCLQKIPQLSADWLLLGKGEMFENSQGDSQHSSQTSAESLSASSTASADLSDQISLLQQLQEENKRLHHKLIQTQEALIKTQQQLLDLIAQHIDNR